MEKKEGQQAKKPRKKTVVYARYSSKNQQEQSIDIQVKACEDFAEKNNYEVVDRYCDYAKTGRNAHRKELQRLISDSYKGKFTVVLVHKIDRWFRNQRESLNCQKTLLDNGIEFISVTEGSTGSRQSKMLLGIQSVIAENESDTISERIKGGQKESASKCQYMGGPLPLGYSVDPVTHKYVIDEQEASIVRKIFDMYVGGTGYTKILEYLNSMGFRTKRGNRFGTGSLHGLLKNEKYKGRYVYGVLEDTIVNGKRCIIKRPPEEWTVVEGGIPAIIDAKLFDRAQKKLALNKKASGQYKAKEVYLLSGIIKCGVCRSPMHVNTRSDGYSSYNCSKNNHRKDCTNRGIRRDELDDYVVDKLYENLFSSSSVKELADALNEHNENMSSKATEEIELARRELRSVKKKINRLLDFVAGGSIREKTASAKLEELEREQRYARKHLKKMKEQNAIVPIPEDMILDLLTESKKLLKAKNDSNAAERRSFIKSYVRRVTVYEDKIKVLFKINVPDTETSQ
jgi:site-specific DNA recombinase